MNGSVLSFGPFLLDRDNALLWCEDKRVPLAPKPFAILCHLAERAGALVSKDELLDAVWSGLHVSESSLTVAMNALRSALGDDRAAPRYIETAPRRGYRFIASVAPAPERPVPPTHSSPLATSFQSTSILDLPRTHYARSADLNLAYQVFGDGPIDLILVPGLITHVEFLHELPGYTDFLRRLARFARVVTFDKSGQGLSDRSLAMPSFEQRVGDIGAIMDAIGTRRAVLLGCSEGGPICMMFAATYPERVSHLLLFGSVARFVSSPDYPHRLSEEEMIRGIEDVWAKNWGTGISISHYLPSYASNPEVTQLYAKLERLTFGPSALKSMIRYNIEIDVRGMLSTIRVPTLVMHRDADLVTIDNGKYLASHIPDAKLVIYSDCSDHAIFAGDQALLCGDIEEFLTGQREAAQPVFDHVLATILVAEVVDSTRRAVEMGDKLWRKTLDEYNQAARILINRHRGTLIKATGDRILATFDSPARAIYCALAFRSANRSFDLSVRSGLHIGEITLRGGDVSGDAVDVAAGILEQANPDEVIVSRLVTDLVAGSSLKFSSRGTHVLSALPGPWELFTASLRASVT